MFDSSLLLQPIPNSATSVPVTPVLCDFGVVKSLKWDENGLVKLYTPNIIPGKVRYAANDVYSNNGTKPLDPLKHDIFQLGVCLYEMLTRETMPWPNRVKGNEGMAASCETSNSWESHLSQHYFPDHNLAVALLRGMLHEDPKERFDMNQVRSHQWLQNINLSQ